MLGQCAICGLENQMSHCVIKCTPSQRASIIMEVVPRSAFELDLAYRGM